MELTRELLEARREELQLQLANLRADMNAVDGAIQQIDWSLAKLEEDDEDAGSSPDSE